MTTSTTNSTTIFPQSNDVALLQNAIRQNRDIRGGKETMFAARLTYFPPLSGQETSDYDKMIEMAPVYTLYPKVVDGFVGTIFRKPMILQGVDEFDSKNVDLLGNSLEEYTQEVTRHVFEDGFCGSIVDWSTELKRSFYRFVKPEDVVSFKSGDNGKGYPELTRFIYKEEMDEDDPDNEFSTEIVTYYNVLDIATNDNGEKQVRSRRYIKLTEGEPEELVGDPVWLVRNGKSVTTLPVVLHGVKANNFTVQKSPLQDISDLNISVDQRVIDLIYLLHWSALPTPYGTGVAAEEIPDSIGPVKGWFFADSAAKVGMLEFSGKSYEAHINYIDSLMFIMSAIGAQILKKEGVSRETASSVLIRTGAQTSLISTMVDNIATQMAKLVETSMEWEDKAYNEDEFKLDMNRDFIQVDMEPNAQIATVKSWLDGAISFDSMFVKFKEGEMIPPERTVEEELALIKKNPPPFFSKQIDHENALSEAEKNASLTSENDGGEQPNQDDTKGSNLETGNEVQNPVATETA